MESEFLSEEEIGALYPGEWVLVKNAEFDEQWRVLRGLVAAHSPDRKQIARVHSELAQSGEPLSVSVLCFKRSPENVALLLVSGKHTSVLPRPKSNWARTWRGTL